MFRVIAVWAFAILILYIALMVGIAVVKVLFPIAVTVLAAVIILVVLYFLGTMFLALVRTDPKKTGEGEALRPPNP